MKYKAKTQTLQAIQKSQPGQVQEKEDIQSGVWSVFSMFLRELKCLQGVLVVWLLPHLLQRKKKDREMERPRDRETGRYVQKLNDYFVKNYIIPFFIHVLSIIYWMIQVQVVIVMLILVRTTNKITKPPPKPQKNYLFSFQLLYNSC